MIQSSIQRRLLVVVQDSGATHLKTQVSGDSLTTTLLHDRAIPLGMLATNTYQPHLLVTLTLVLVGKCIQALPRIAEGVAKRLQKQSKEGGPMIINILAAIFGIIAAGACAVFVMGPSGEHDTMK